MKQKPYHSETLDTIRQKIDELDTRIHDTLVERAELVLQIGEEKRKNNIEIVQPAREARMIRRLLSKHKGALPEMAVVRIWRELVGAVSMLQTGLSVTVAHSDSCPEYWDLAKDYFGSCLPMSRSATALAAIAAVRDGRSTFAVLPYPSGTVESEEEKLWWEMLEPESDNALSIIVRLPHGDDPEHQNPDYRAVIVGKTGFDTSDNDNSFLYIECDTSVSRDRITSCAKQAGLEPISLSSKNVTGDDTVRRHLLEVHGYQERGSGKLEGLRNDLGENTIVIAVGGYPVPCAYSKTIVAKSDSIPTAPPQNK